mgnify:CR=1 FL=1
MFAGLRVFIAIAVCLAAFSAIPTHAAPGSSKYDTLKAGPAVGTQIPHDLKTVDHRNQHRDFKSLAHSRGLVILFSRSLDW